MSALARTLLAALLAAAPAAAAAQVAGGPPPPGPERVLDVNEYRVDGVTRLSEPLLQEVLAPFLGPGRPLSDVERARAAVEKAYTDRGFQAVTVAIPQQTVREGVVALSVTEGRVAKLRVRGARWFLPSEVKRLAPSVAEGKVPNFDEIVRDIFVLNQLADRRVVPALKAGVLPGTVFVDLDVEDHLPLHASLEVNDRYSLGTTRTRTNATVHYDNLFQRGHSLTFSAQLAPERTGDGKVFSLTYLARFPDVTWLSLTANGILQDSDISTLGGAAVAGRSRIAGARATFTLQATAGWFQTVSLGADYKYVFERTDRELDLTYWPATVQWLASWQGEASRFQAGASAVFGLRPLGSSPAPFDRKRYQAQGNFFYLRGELSRGDTLAGLELSERVSGQFSAAPLVGPEQLSAGGADTVRGYVEAQAAGDFGLTGQLELRSPSLARGFLARFMQDWRFHAFLDGGWVGLQEALPEQKARFLLAGAGVGTRLAFFGHVSGTLELGVPLREVAREPRLHFKLVSQF